jgi:hypothetical protein
MAILLVKLPQSEISFDEPEGFFHARPTPITLVNNLSNLKPCHPEQRRRI